MSQSIEQRVQVLERTARRWKRLFGVAAVVAVLAMVCGAAAVKRKPGHVVTSSVTIVNADGRPVAALYTTDEGLPAFHMFKPGQTKRISISVALVGENADPLILLNDPSTKAGMKISTTRKSGAAIIMQSKKGTDTIFAASDVDGRGVMSTLDAAGNVTWSGPSE